MEARDVKRERREREREKRIAADLVARQELNSRTSLRRRH